MEKLSHQELLERQRAKGPEFRISLCVVLNNIRSLHNVGSIFRTCDGVGAKKLWLCGITGFPPHSKIEKTSLGAEKTVPWEYREEIVPLVRELKEEGYQIVLLEQTRQSIPFEAFMPRAPVCLILGNEVEGTQAELLSYADAAVEIEMAGAKNSLNVTVACGIMAYHLRNRLKGLAASFIPKDLKI